MKSVTAVEGSLKEDLDRPYLEKLQPVQFRPIFIMGDHRSGTTISYKVLGASGCFNIVTAYHVICYRRLLHDYLHGTVDEGKLELAGLFHQKNQREREIDRMPLTPDLPEEYGFVFQSAGFKPRLGKDTRTEFVELCKKIQFTSNGSRMVLLKNPWDYYLHFMHVKRLFPRAKFIFVHRNPIRTINSQLRALRSTFDRKNEYIALLADWYDELFRKPYRLKAAKFFYSSHFNLGLRVASRHLAKGTNYFLKNAPLLAENDHVSVRYEDLCENPDSTIRGVLDWLNLEEPEPVNYGSHIQVREGSLLSEVEQNRQMIFKKMPHYFRRFHYRQDQ